MALAVLSSAILIWCCWISNAPTSASEPAFCQQVRRREHAPRGPGQPSRLRIMVLSAWGADQRQAAMDAGADDYVLKPFDAIELFTRVRRLTNYYAAV